MNKKFCIFFAVIFALFLTGCVTDPDDYILKTKEEILAYMNNNYPAHFEIKNVTVQDEHSFPKEINVILTSDKTGDKEIKVIHNYERQLFGVWENFETNFYSIYYSDDFKQKIDSIYSENMPPEYPCKNFYSVNEEWMRNCETLYKDFEDYFANASYIGNVTTVVKGQLKEIPTDDKPFFSFCVKLKKMNSFNKKFIFAPEVDLENITEEEKEGFFDSSELEYLTIY